MKFIKFNQSLLNSRISKLKAVKLENDGINHLFTLLKVKDWKFDSDRVKINKNFEFKDFDECFSKMDTLSKLAEVMCHHPEWFNVYNRLNIDLATHDVNGISVKDIVFAKGVDLVINENKGIEDLVNTLDQDVKLLN